MNRTALLMMCLFGFGTDPAIGQVVRYVRAGAPANGDGQSWATAFNTLQPAITASAAGDEIWVSTGSYSDVSASGRSAFDARSGITLYGGFSGTESDRSQRSPSQHIAILTGNSSRSVLRFEGVTGAVIDGFTLTGGLGKGSFSETLTDPAWHPGGAASIDGSSVTFIDCKFLANSGTWSRNAQSLPTGVGEGGASAIRNSTVSFRRCEFANNRASGAFIAGCGGGQFQVWTGPAGGGALHCRSSTVTLSDCVFSNNYAGSGASTGYCTQWGSGANVPQRGASGGAIQAVASTLQIDRCAFLANGSGPGGSGASALGNCVGFSAESGSGGAISLGGGTAVISNSVFSGNFVPRSGLWACSGDVGGSGAAVYSEGTTTIFNSTFYANHALATNGGSGAVAGAFVSIRNSIFWANLDGSAPPLGAQIGNVSLAKFNRCIINAPPAAVGPNNFAFDPLFANPDGDDGVVGNLDGNLSLAVGSPAIDAGNNGYYLAGELDRAGGIRFHDFPTVANTGIGAAPLIDLGAYELSHCPADLDDEGSSGVPDGAVTVADLLRFLQMFEQGSTIADVDNGASLGVLDNAVTIDDLLFFLARFEGGC